MSKKTEVLATGKREIPDPVLPFTEISIDGKTYKMCFDYGAIALAESKFREAGHRDVYLLLAAPEPEVIVNLKFLFACSLQVYHPEVKYDEALKMVGPANQQAIYVACKAAWGMAMPDPESADGSDGTPAAAAE